MKIEIVKENGQYALHVCGPLTIRLDNDTIKKAIRAAKTARLAGDEEDELAGFFDVLSRGLSSVTQVTNNPLVKQVLTAIPYGGTAMTAIELAQHGAKLGARAMAKKPKVARLVRAAANNDPAALQTIREIKRDAKKGDPKAAQLLNTVRQFTELSIDQETLQKIVARAIPPTHELVYE